jgi:hypothetical protein
MDDIEAWWSAVGMLPEALGPRDLPNLNEGLRYLFKELREAQAAFSSGSHLDGTYSSLVAVLAFLSLFRVTSIEGLASPLAALESALWALDEGITQPLLRPAVALGHPSCDKNLSAWWLTPSAVCAISATHYRRHTPRWQPI